MYLRLAFSIAAHFEPDVLLLDEVIAVGDISFQQKCFDKMQAVSREGKTIFLVSHNLSSIQSLCSRVFLVRSGQLCEGDDPQEVISSYVKDQLPKQSGVKKSVTS